MKNTIETVFRVRNVKTGLYKTATSWTKLGKIYRRNKCAQTAAGTNPDLEVVAYALFEVCDDLEVNALAAEIENSVRAVVPEPPVTTPGELDAGDE